jgi:hypothetical protein
VPGADTQGIVVLVEVLVVLVVLVELLDEVVLDGGKMTGSGSPHWASAHETSSPSGPTSVRRHTLAGSAQCVNGIRSRSHSLGMSQRGPRGSTHMHPAKKVMSVKVAWNAWHRPPFGQVPPHVGNSPPSHGTISPGGSVVGVVSAGWQIM